MPLGRSGLSDEPVVDSTGFDVSSSAWKVTFWVPLGALFALLGCTTDFKIIRTYYYE